VHAGFSGFRAFVARKKVGFKLIGNRFVFTHDTIPWERFGYASPSKHLPDTATFISEITLLFCANKKSSQS